MGGYRNVPYTYSDITANGNAQQVTWKDLGSQETTLRKINNQLSTPHTGVRLAGYPDESELRYRDVAEQVSEPRPAKQYTAFHKPHKSGTNLKHLQDQASQSSKQPSIFESARDARESARNIDKLIKNHGGKRKKKSATPKEDRSPTAKRNKYGMPMHDQTSVAPSEQSLLSTKSRLFNMGTSQSKWANKVYQEGG